MNRQVINNGTNVAGRPNLDFLRPGYLTYTDGDGLL